ncbi:MAG: hypothetical protein FWE45_03535 [Firmicutes bacterium]|nr:hypothetical protein [Bacillota bacterium]
MENQKYKSKVWDQVQAMIDEETSSLDSYYRNNPKYLDSLLAGVGIFEKFVAKYSHLPTISPRKIKCKALAAETYNAASLYRGSQSQSSSQLKKQVYSAYEIYPRYEEFVSMYNEACLQDYIYENDCLPLTKFTYGGIYHKGVNVAHILANFCEDQFPKESVKNGEITVKDIPILSEFKKEA